jgi:hypothetical protein
MSGEGIDGLPGMINGGDNKCVDLFLKLSYKQTSVLTSSMLTLTQVDLLFGPMYSAAA